MRKSAYILLAAVGMTACNYLEIEPVGQVIPHKTSEFRALLTSGYYAYPFGSARTYTCLLSDEVATIDAGAFWNASEVVPLGYNFTWQYGGQMQEYPYQYFYQSMFYANAVIENIRDADVDDADEPMEQILGEAYALRAYNHFELVNLYGKPYDPQTADSDRGIVLSDHIDIEQSYRPTTVGAVYAHILDDIAQAEQLISLEKQPDETRNYRFSLNAVRAFKARVLLYMQQWQQAYDLASALIPKYELLDLNTLGEQTVRPWKAESSEAILALDRPFSYSGGDLMRACLLSQGILGLFDVQNDCRYSYLKKIDISGDEGGSGMSGYGVDRSSSDRISIRAAELYLIAAEAGSYLPAELAAARRYLLDLQAKRLKPEALEAQQSKIEAMDAAQLRAEIADERAREFLMEGHRWLDLRRTTRPAITKTYDGSSYTLNANDSRYTLPFPQSAIAGNPDLND